MSQKLLRLASSLRMSPSELKQLEDEAKTAYKVLRLGQTQKIISWRRRGLMLKEIRLLGTAIKFSRIIRMECIVTIDITCNMCGSMGAGILATALMKSPTLISLCIGENSLKDEGVEAIAPLVKNNAALKELDIRGNYVTSQGVQAICDALIHSSSLTALGLAYNRLTHAGLLPLVAIGFGYLKTIDLRGNALGKRAAELLGAGIISNQRRLQRFDIRENPGMCRTSTAILGRAARDRQKLFRESQRNAKRIAKKAKKKFTAEEPPPQIEFYWVQTSELEPLPGSSKATTFVASALCSLM